MKKIIGSLLLTSLCITSHGIAVNAIGTSGSKVSPSVSVKSSPSVSISKPSSSTSTSNPSSSTSTSKPSSSTSTSKPSNNGSKPTGDTNKSTTTKPVNKTTPSVPASKGVTNTAPKEPVKKGYAKPTSHVSDYDSSYSLPSGLYTASGALLLFWGYDAFNNPVYVDSETNEAMYDYDELDDLLEEAIGEDREDLAEEVYAANSVEAEPVSSVEPADSVGAENQSEDVSVKSVVREEKVIFGSTFLFLILVITGLLIPLIAKGSRH